MLVNVEDVDNLRLSEKRVELLSMLSRKCHLKIIHMTSNQKLEETALTLMVLWVLTRSCRNFSVKDGQRDLFQHRDLVSVLAATKQSGRRPL